MADLRVIGAGVGRTGTNSLKLALERLLGAPCYHMLEVFKHPDHVPLWHAGVNGDAVDFRALLAGYAAAVDWPSTAFWPALAELFPEALVVLSVREVDSWWKSFDETILAGRRKRAEGPPDPFLEMTRDMFERTFDPNYTEEADARRAFERHNETVRRTAPRGRFLEWSAKDGWEPLCRALGVAVPDEPFPHVNTTDEFRARAGLAQ